MPSRVAAGAAAAVAEIVETARADAFLAAPVPAALVDGTLAAEDLHSVATQYFHLVDALPRLISMTHAVTARHPGIRRALLRVLVDVELEPPSLSERWLETCAALGLYPESIRASHPNHATGACLGDLEYLCQSGSAQGIATLLACATLLPVVGGAQRAALVEHYGVDAGGSHESYATFVATKSSEHSALLATALEDLLTEHPEAIPAAIDAGASTLVAIGGLYDGARIRVR